MTTQELVREAALWRKAAEEAQALLATRQELVDELTHMRREFGYLRDLVGARRNERLDEAVQRVKRERDEAITALKAVRRVLSDGGE